MDGRSKRKRLVVTLLVFVALIAVPSMGDQKISLFNPFTMQSKTVTATSAPSVGLDDLMLLGGPTTVSSKLSDGDPRPTISLRGVKIRIPQRPNLRSAYSRIPYAASVW